MIYTKRGRKTHDGSKRGSVKEEEQERKSPESSEFWRNVFREFGASEMRYLSLSRLGEDECTRPWGSSLRESFGLSPHYNLIETCLGMGVIREEFPEKVAFNC